MKNFLSTKNAPILLIIGAYLLNKFGILQVGGIDYLFIVAVVALYSLINGLAMETHANRIMNLVLYHTLLRSDLIKASDAFFVQNHLLGETAAQDGDKLREELREENIYLHNYLSNEEFREHITEIEENDFSIFRSYAGLTERYKEEHIPRMMFEKSEKVVDTEEQ